MPKPPILWCPADEIDEAHRVAAEACHAAANAPRPRAIRSLNVCAEINERLSREALLQGREEVARHHSEIAERLRADSATLSATAY